VIRPVARSRVLTPRQPRILHQGPRAKLLELAFLLHVVVVMLAAFAAIVLWKDEDARIWATLLVGAALALLALDVTRFRQLRKLRNLAQAGSIAMGEVTGSRLHRWSRLPRADRALPKTTVPLAASLEVTYAFAAIDGRVHAGSFATRSSDGAVFTPGSRIEIFYDGDEPDLNVSSLVLRWYYRLGGATVPDEAPDTDFEEHEVEVEWWE
jgi:hypothetical protein